MKNMKRILLILFLLLIVCGCKKKEKCPEGYNEENNKCVKEIERFEAEVSYYCDPDTTTEGETCLRQIVVPAEEVTGCKDGLTEENGYCVGTLTEPQVDAYKCNSGETLRGNKCVKSTVDDSALTKTPKCQNGFTYENGYCWSGPKPPMGDDGKCDWEHGDYTDCYCDGGDQLRSDHKCYEKKNPEYDYSCASGTNLKNNKCYKETETDATSYKKCNSGYTLKDNVCTKQVKEKVSKVLSCPADYTLNDNNCEKMEVEPAVPNYHCPDDYDLVEKSCVKLDIKDLN